MDNGLPLRQTQRMRQMRVVRGNGRKPLHARGTAQRSEVSRGKAWGGRLREGQDTEDA